MKKVLWLSGLLFLAVLTSCSSKGRFRYEEGIAWNTVYHITFEADRDLSDSIAFILDEIDSSLSPFNESSVVSKINDNLTDSVDLHFIAVYDESRKIHQESGGAFDPTLAPVIKAWGFGQGHELSGDTLRLDSLLKCVGIERTEIESFRIAKEDERIQFNFSALAKGYGVDQMAEMLIRNGVMNFLVEIGGEIRVSGHNPEGNEWRIGIDRPDSEAPAGDIIDYIALRDGAVATSGNYRNFQESGGVRLGHTISPATGRPVQTDVISATVISPSCMEADALATVCMVVGSSSALELCTRLKAGVMLVTSGMEVLSNSIWQDAEPEKGDRD